MKGKWKTTLLLLTFFSLGFLSASAYRLLFSEPTLIQTILTGSSPDFQVITSGLVGYEILALEGNITLYNHYPTWMLSTVTGNYTSYSLTASVQYVTHSFPTIVTAVFYSPSSFSTAVVELSPDNYQVINSATAGYQLLVPSSITYAEYTRETTLSFSLLSSSSRQIEASRASSLTTSIGFSLSRSLDATRQPSQAVGLNISVEKMKELLRSAVLGISIELNSTRVFDASRSLFSSVSIDVASSRQVESIRQVLQDLTLSAFSLKIYEVTRDISQQIIVSPFSSRIAEFDRSVSQSFSIETSVSRLSEFIRSVLSVFSLSPSVEVFTSKIYYAYPSLSFSISPLVSRIADITHVQSISIGLSETVSKSVDFLRNIVLNIATTMGVTTQLPTEHSIGVSLVLSLSASSSSHLIVYRLPSGGGLVIYSIPYLDIEIPTIYLEGGWWKDGFTIPLHIWNRNEVGTDIVIHYELLSGTRVLASGNFTIFVSGFDRKIHELKLPRLEDGRYQLIVAAIEPATAKSSSTVIVSTPFYNTLEFLALVILLCVASIASIILYIKKKWWWQH